MRGMNPNQNPSEQLANALGDTVTRKVPVNVATRFRWNYVGLGFTFTVDDQASHNPLGENHYVLSFALGPLQLGIGFPKRRWVKVSAKFNPAAMGQAMAAKETSGGVAETSGVGYASRGHGARITSVPNGPSVAKEGEIFNLEALKRLRKRPHG